MVVMSARHAHTCYDQKHVAGQDTLRSSTFHCFEHQPAAIENLLLPKVLCCNGRECVPSFAEARQRFPIESITCNESNEHCDILLRCQGEFEEFCKVVVVALACVTVVILSQFCLQPRMRNFKITKHSMYEQDKSV